MPRGLEEVPGRPGSNHPSNTFAPPWWVSPWGIGLFVLLPVAAGLAFYTPRYIVIGEIRYAGAMLVLLLLTLAVFSASAILARLVHEETARPPLAPYAIRDGFLDFLALVTVLAYAIWFRSVLTSPGLALDVLVGQRTSLRDDIGTIPGITTLSQFGVVYAVGYALNVTVLGRIPLRHHFFFVALGLLALFRTLMWSERLAALEYFVPPLLFFCANWRPRSGRFLKAVLEIFPYLLILSSYLFFSMAEYFRSWKFFRGSVADFFGFMFDRWIAYYYTSLNNGAFFLSFNLDSLPDFRFRHVLISLYQLPGIGPWLTRAMGIYSDPEKIVLDRYLNPEFNVFSGIYPIYFDFGIMAGLVFWAAFGYLCGLFYLGFSNRRRFGLLMYPTLYVGLLEVLRIEYVVTTRYVYVAAGCVLAYFFFRRSILGDVYQSDRTGGPRLVPSPRWRGDSRLEPGGRIS